MNTQLRSYTRFICTLIGALALGLGALAFAQPQ